MYVCGAYKFVYTRMWGRQTEQERGKEKESELKEKRRKTH